MVEVRIWVYDWNTVLRLRDDNEMAMTMRWRYLRQRAGVSVVWVSFISTHQPYFKGLDAV